MQNNPPNQPNQSDQSNNPSVTWSAWNAFGQLANYVTPGAILAPLLPLLEPGTPPPSQASSQIQPPANEGRSKNPPKL